MYLESNSHEVYRVYISFLYFLFKMDIVISVFPFLLTYCIAPYKYLH